jgi:hypothetical protein
LADITPNGALPEFQAFLLSPKISPEKNVPFYPRWVSKFLVFSKQRRIFQTGKYGRQRRPYGFISTLSGGAPE